jgi:hypothetical protein
MLTYGGDVEKNANFNINSIDFRKSTIRKTSAKNTIALIQ